MQIWKFENDGKNSLEILHELYNWDKYEPNKEFFTCRPLKELPDLKTYCDKLVERLLDGKQELYILLSEMKKPYGRVTMFDFNHRNHSAEFGYYLPPEHRGKGLGKIMIKLYLDRIFVHSELNKLYATTSSSNISSIKLLESLDFHLDGRLREHYWIDNLRFDQLNYSMLRADWK